MVNIILDSTMCILIKSNQSFECVSPFLSRIRELGDRLYYSSHRNQKQNLCTTFLANILDILTLLYTGETLCPISHGWNENITGSYLKFLNKYDARDPKGDTLKRHIRHGP